MVRTLYSHVYHVFQSHHGLISRHQKNALNFEREENEGNSARYFLRKDSYYPRRKEHYEIQGIH